MQRNPPLSHPSFSLSSPPISEEFFYRNHAARTAEIAVGELSPAVADAPTSRDRFAAAVAAVGGVGGDGVTGSCYPYSGHYSNTYQPRPRSCTDTPRRSCTRCPGRSRRPPPRFDTRRTATPRRRRLRGSTASPEAVPDHLAPRPPGRVTGTRSLVVPCKMRTTLVMDADAARTQRHSRRSNCGGYVFVNILQRAYSHDDGEIFLILILLMRGERLRACIQR